mmetsp:Transcript_4572/g.7379  ORF Transcript_4572/g.7379 Transcript_4572/m.7379 type:complete len:131 (+) Transcript_4572:479-871(+)
MCECPNVSAPQPLSPSVRPYLSTSDSVPTLRPSVPQPLRPSAPQPLSSSALWPQQTLSTSARLPLIPLAPPQSLAHSVPQSLSPISSSALRSLFLFTNFILWLLVLPGASALSNIGDSCCEPDGQAGLGK